jgi:hypothetical protein
MHGTTIKKSGEDYLSKSFTSCTISKYYSGDKIKKHEMGGACGMYWEEERYNEYLVGRQLRINMCRWG